MKIVKAAAYKSIIHRKGEVSRGACAFRFGPRFRFFTALVPTKPTSSLFQSIHTLSTGMNGRYLLSGVDAMPELVMILLSFSFSDSYMYPGLTKSISYCYHVIFVNVVDFACFEGPVWQLGSLDFSAGVRSKDLTRLCQACPLQIQSINLVSWRYIRDFKISETQNGLVFQRHLLCTLFS